MAGTYEQAKVGDPNSSAGPKWVAQFLGQNEALDSSNKTPSSSLSLGNLGRLYAPTIIATEQERESTSFGTLTTADEVKSVVLPENGLIVLGYAATWKSSVGGAGQAAIFLNATQVKMALATKGAPTAQAATTQGTPFNFLGTNTTGLKAAKEEFGTSQVTTGQILGVESESGQYGGFTTIFAAAGTYNVSVQFKATSGKVVAKERKLWVGVMGV